MWCRRVLVCLLLVVLVVPVLAGCPSSAEVKEDKVVGPPEGMTSVEVYEDAARWLPSSSVVVMSTAHQNFWELVGEGLLPTVNPDAEPGSAGTVEAMRSDLVEIIKDTIGFDAASTEAVVVGGHMMGGTAVLFGEFEMSDELLEVDVNDRQGYEWIMDDEEFSDPYAQPTSLFLLPIDEPRQGLVVSFDIDMLRQLERDKDLSLASVPRGAAIAERMRAHDGGTHTVVVPLQDIPMLAMFGMPALDWATIHFDSYQSRMIFEFEGPETSLDQVAQYVSMARSAMQDGADEIYNEFEGEEFMEGVSGLFMEHLFAAVDGQLEPQRETGRLRYEMRFSEGFVGGAMLGMGIVVPLMVYFWLGDDDPYYDDTDVIEL